MGIASNRNCVMGGQGSPREPVVESGPAKTHGSSMSHPAATPAATRIVFWIAFFAVLAVLGPGSVALHADAGKDYYKRGQAAEATEDYDAAYLNYQRAYAASPKNLHYRASLYRVRLSASAMHVTKGRKLVNSGDEQGALVEFLRAAEIDPGNEAAQQEIGKVRNRYVQQAQAQTSAASLPAASGQQSGIDTIASPTDLRPMSSEPLTLHMVEDSKVVYQAVGKAAGVNVLFDPDYIGKRIQVDLNNVSLMDALRIVGTLSGTFWRPVTSNTIFVAANTRAKRTEMEEQAVQTFYLTNAWQANDLNDVQTALRNVLPSAKVYGVASQNAIVMRATPDELLLAQKLINDLDKARPEVVVDISVLEVAKNWEQTLGIAWPQSIGVTLQSSSSTTSTTGTSTTTGVTPTTAAPTVYDLAHLKASDFAVNIGTATANMLLTDSNTTILQNPRIRSTDAQKATLKIGQRIPIATGSFQSGVGVAAAISPMAETQFQYIDVGVNIDMTPTVHYDGDVTLKMKIDVSSQSGNVTISGVTEPIIAQKTSEQTIRLREGEASILGGILNQQEQESWTGIPGLSSIPILKYLFGSKDRTKTDDEIVFLLVPHIVRSPILTSANLRSIDTGAGQAIDLRHVSTQGAGPAVITPIPPARPQAAAPVTGTVAGQTAEAAGPAALAQMRAAAQSTDTAAAAPAPQTTALPPQGLNFSLVAPHDPVAAGATFQVPVVIAGAADIAAVPLQIQYDAAKLTLVNVDNGDFLGRSGQAVALVHRDDGPGNITLNASLPPGSAGVSGAGVVCMLTFQAKAPGAAAVVITRPGAMTSAQKPVQAQGAQATVVVK